MPPDARKYLMMNLKIISTHRSWSKENLTEGSGELDKEEGEGETQVEDVVRSQQLSQLSLRLLSELECFPKVCCTEIRHH